MADEFDQIDELNPEDYLRSLGYSGQADELSYKEAMKLAMDKMFDDSEHEGSVCHRLWCQDMGECLWVTLQNLQRDFNELFFEDELKEEELLVADEDILRYLQEGCSLPEDWYEEGKRENSVINFVLELLQTIQYDPAGQELLEEFLESDEGQDFGRNLYRLLQYALLEKDQDNWNDAMEAIAEFLNETELLHDEDRGDFLLRLSALK